MSAPVPSLSASGWVTGVAEKADKLISYFFTSEDSQSLIYDGQVFSLPGIIKRHGNDPRRITTETKESLEALLSRYFESVDIKVTYKLPDDNDDNRMDIIIDCVVGDGNTSYELGRLLSVVNSSIEEIINKNNNG
jgi:hypothetical protein